MAEIESPPIVKPPINLTTLTLPHIPGGSHNVHIAVLKDIKNAEYIRSQLVAGNGDFEYAFVDAVNVRFAYSLPTRRSEIGREMAKRRVEKI